ncbi:MAG TPA: hypothetical protein VMQ46_07490 [Acidimicrobiia bacterium]|nr:hypothetical protein [Acidimicrobiia bacterium]
MHMADIVTDRLSATLDLTETLARHLEEDAMQSRLQGPSNTVWEQFWCVVGARESYAKAMEAGSWAGFDCSLTAADRGSKSRLVAALESSRDTVERAVRSADPSEEMIIDLLLHETQHHGQLIRYIYGLGLDFPESWRRRWSL